MVNSGLEHRSVDVTEKPNYTRGIMETFRLDTGEMVKYRELKESEKTKGLFAEEESGKGEEFAAPDVHDMTDMRDVVLHDGTHATLTVGEASVQ